MKWQTQLMLSMLLCLGACKPSESGKEDSASRVFHLNNPQTVSLLGKTLRSPEPSPELTLRWREKADNYYEDSTNVDNIIWCGRFTAYMGDHVKAINIYTNGILLHDEEPRLFRHRGHRYITLRKFDKAIADLNRAKELIAGSENQIEPDGMPNAQNIPVSTLHGNIYYHLGLAYYLQGDLNNALSAYKLCLATSESPDNVVSAVHWLYCILMRMNRQEEALSYLENVRADMPIIENHSYHKLCLFYKNEIPIDQLINPEANTPANDAVKYGVANWYLVNGQNNDGVQILKKLVTQNGWGSFGIIAAEADLARGIN